jgi:N-acetylneuraminic acid mutarotase
MSYPQKDDEIDSDYLHLNKYIHKDDKELFRKIHNSNNNYGNTNKNISSKISLIKIDVNQMEYPNPVKSLGIIRNNQYIYSELNKNNLTRQSESFNKQIEEINHINVIYGKKMPKVHITDILLKEPSNIPVINIAKRKKSVNLLSILEKSKKDLKLFSYYKYPIKNFPEGREQFSLCRQDNDIIIAGGISTKMKTLAIWKLNLTTLEWQKVTTENYIENRYGHTALSLNNKLYIFGGLTKYLNTYYMNNLDIFSFTEKKIINNQIYGEKPENRKSHIAVFVGAQMLIHGGITDEERILDDSYLFNMHTSTWNKCIINKICDKPKLWGHACCLVIPGQILYNPKFSIYSFPEFDTIKKKNIKKKGLFIFGGKSNEDGLSNQLWILIMGKKPLDWIKVETKGKPPIPRYFHTMNFYERGNYVIIHGGRNDIFSEKSALNDTFLLNLENFEWLEVKLYSNSNNFNIVNRCGHQSIIYSDKLIILGGMNNNNYLGSSLLIINLDFSYSNNPFRDTIESKLMELSDKNSANARNKAAEIKRNLKLKEIGVVNNVTLPVIK